MFGLVFCPVLELHLSQRLLRNVLSCEGGEQGVASAAKPEFKALIRERLRGLQ